MSAAAPPYNTRPLRVAVLLNSYRSPFIGEIRDSYVRTAAAAATTARGSERAVLTFFYPAEQPDRFPDPAAFDLVVVGGGNADPRKRHPWILRVHRFILDLVARQSSTRTKLCGICWGHQTIAMLFGGDIVDMDTPEVYSPLFPPSLPPLFSSSLFPPQRLIKVSLARRDRDQADTRRAPVLRPRH